MVADRSGGGRWLTGRWGISAVRSYLVGVGGNDAGALGTVVPQGQATGLERLRYDELKIWEAQLSPLWEKKKPALLQQKEKRK